MASTKEVLDHHVKCFGAGDISGILSDYTPDAALFAMDRTHKGPDAIRKFFAGMFAEFAKPGVSFEMKYESIDGDVAYIVWNAETADNVYDSCTDTFVIRGGKIVAQAFGGKVTPKR